MSRHTAAVYLLNSHVPIETVSRILGHKEGSRETKMYAKYLDQTVYEDIVNLEMDQFSTLSAEAKQYLELEKTLSTEKRGD